MILLVELLIYFHIAFTVNGNPNSLHFLSEHAYELRLVQGNVSLNCSSLGILPMSESWKMFFLWSSIGRALHC